MEDPEGQMAMTFIILLTCLLLFVSVSASLMTYSFFWYENAWRARLAGKNGSKLKPMVAAGFLSSVASMFIIMISYPFGLIRRLWSPGEIVAGQPIIILTHGLYHNQSAWLLMRRRLKRAGFKNIFLCITEAFSPLSSKR